MRVLLMCPIPEEHGACRSALSLRDTTPVLGCRTARGAVAQAEVMSVQCGPGKARAAAATVAAIDSFSPDVVADTGTCAALDANLIVGAVILATGCLEYDVSGGGLPARISPHMKLPSAFDFMSRRDAQRLPRDLTGLGSDRGVHLRPGLQASGEFFIQSVPVREQLFTLTGAAGCSWETAGVFIAALRSRVPPLSIRVVSDLGDEDALRDFRRNARKCSQALYRFLATALEAGWFAAFSEKWSAVPRGQVDRMPARVLP